MPITVNTCIVTGQFLNPQGAAVSGATVRFVTQSPVVDTNNNIIQPYELSTTTASDGTWSLTLVQGITGKVTLDLNPTVSFPITKYTFSVAIPLTSTAIFVACWVEGPNYTGSATNLPLTFSQISGQLSTSQLPILPSANIWVGNASNVATAVVLSGDASLSNSGALTVSTIGGKTAVYTTTNQIVAGVKTFSSAPNLSSLTPSQALVLDGSNNVTTLQYTYSNTGNALAQRDSNGNIYANNVVDTTTTVVSAGGTTVMSGGSSRITKITGTQTQTFTLPDATTLVTGWIFEFNNNSTQSITINNKGGSLIVSPSSLSYAKLICIDNSTSNGAWDYHWDIPSSVNWGTQALPVLYGGTGVTSVTTSPTASSFSGWDTNKNLSANSFISGFTSTATAASTTTLTVSSTEDQYFSGSTTQTVLLPVVSTLVTGQRYNIYNMSSGTVTVQSSGANTIQAMGANSKLELECISISGTGTSSWNWVYTSQTAGTVTSVTFTGDGTILSSTPSSAVTTSGTVTASLNTQTARTFLTGPLGGSAAAPTFKALTAPTIQKFTSTGSTTGYVFTISTSTTCAVNDTYTNNGNTYTVLAALSAQSGQVMFMSGSGAPLASGTLTRSAGAGTASVTYTLATALGTYTTPSSPAPLSIRVRLVGGGGGGGGSGTAGGSGVSAGTSTFFGALLLAGNGGGAGQTNGGGSAVAGGTASLGSGPIGLAFQGSGGAAGSGVAATNEYGMGGSGGCTPFGGAGMTVGNTTGQSAIANTGSGGGGGGTGNSITSGGGGGGGGGGGYVDAIITSPASTYVYCIGSGGSNGSAGTNGNAGGSGGSGFIIVEESYQ